MKFAETPPGRPRDPALDRRILEITLARMQTDGYSRMSIDAIATEAGVSKPTIYRRWTDKADLALSALTLLRVSEPAIPADSPRARLVGLLQNFRRSLTRPHGFALVGTVMAEEEQTPQLLEAFRRRIVAPRREMLLAVLEEARARGELRKDADLEAAVTMLAGSFYARFLAGEPIPSRWVERIVDVVWRGIAR